MPISKTTAGLIYWDNCDDLGSWVPKPEPNGIIAYGTVDDVDAYAGHSIYTYAQTQLTSSPFWLSKTVDVGSGAGRRVHFWHKVTNVNYPPGYVVAGQNLIALKIGDQILCQHNALGSQGWHKINNYVTPSGPQEILMGYHIGRSDYYSSNWSYQDSLIICKSDIITVTGLTAGQKVKLYRYVDNMQVDTSKTVSGGETSVTFDLSSEEFPEYLYLKIYGPTGVTLIETTPSYFMCGGDSWAWLIPETIPLRVTSAQAIIYKQTAVAVPKTANITATLLKEDGTPHAGKTLTLATSLGNLTTTSGITDDSGNVETQLTGAVHGPAVIHAYFPSDGVVPPYADLIADLQAAHWAITTGWASPAGTLNKNADGVGPAVPKPTLPIVAGAIYRVVITVSACTVGSCSYTLGGTPGPSTLSAATTYTHYVTATNTDNMIFTPSAPNSRFTISAVSVKAPADAYTMIHIFDEAEAPDASKAFQFYNEGIEYPYIGGSYAQNNEGITEGFEIELDKWYTSFAFLGLVSIYRRGVKEFMGLLLGSTRTLGEHPQVILRGSDLSFLLGQRLIGYELYAIKTPRQIVSSLLTKYPCGLSPGVITDTPTLTLEFDTANLAEALANLCDLIGGLLRVKQDMTVDLATSFGEERAITFAEGTNIVRGRITLS